MNRGVRGACSGADTSPHESRFSLLNSDSEGESWQHQTKIGSKNKRKRHSTGGTYGYYEGPEASQNPARYQIMSKSEFRGLPTDEKLVTMFEAITEIGSLYGRVENVEHNVEKLKIRSQAHDNRIRLVEYKSIDMEARSRRNNLIFRGHPETVENDNCVEIVRKFLLERLDLDPGMCIQRAHRLGNMYMKRRNRGGISTTNTQPRPIIVNFRDYQDVELILQNAKKLKDTPFGINRDYPKEIINARSKLWPMFKKARDDNRNGNVYIGYPAKLIVNGKVISDQFPNWRNVLRGSRVQEINTNIGVSVSECESENAQVPDSQSLPARETPINEIQDNSDDAMSMASVRSRSRSRSMSGSRSRSKSVFRPRSKSISPNRPRETIPTETVSETQCTEKDKNKAPNTENNSQNKGAEGSSQISDKQRSDKEAQSEKQTENGQKKLTAYDLEMKRLSDIQTASHTRTRAASETRLKKKTDTGQTNRQNQQS